MLNYLSKEQILVFLSKTLEKNNKKTLCEIYEKSLCRIFGKEIVVCTKHIDFSSFYIFERVIEKWDLLKK